MNTPASSYKKAIGRRGEELAADYLRKQGFTVLAQNAYVSHDEIDIIASDGKYIVFAEVKTRAQTKSNQRYGRPAAAVNYAKQQHLIRAAEDYLREHPSPGLQPRIDVIEVFLPAIHPDTPIDFSALLPLEIRHIRSAVHK